MYANCDEYQLKTNCKALFEYFFFNLMTIIGKSQVYLLFFTTWQTVRFSKQLIIVATVYASFCRRPGMDNLAKAIEPREYYVQAGHPVPDTI